MRITMPDPEEGVTRPVLHELKVISASKTRYKPGSEKRAVDVRADALQKEYLMKARVADRRSGIDEGQIGRAEAKLLSMGTVRGLVCGNWGEVSEDTHALLNILATNRVRVAGPSTGRKGKLRSESGKRAVMGYLRRTLGVATVRAQCKSLLGRLEVLGPGMSAAAGRRKQATELERRWRLQQQASSLSVRQGWVITGQGLPSLTKH